MKKVKVIEINNDYSCTVNWSYLIESNFHEFCEFSKQNWHCQYEDKEEFIYQWIKEINLYMAGCVSDKFYKTIAEFVDTLVPF